MLLVFKAPAPVWTVDYPVSLGRLLGSPKSHSLPATSWILRCLTGTAVTDAGTPAPPIAPREDPPRGQTATRECDVPSSSHEAATRVALGWLVTASP
ncbi:unnamed protein product [Cutaneotrichosporon oleaginosum]